MTLKLTGQESDLVKNKIENDKLIKLQKGIQKGIDSGVCDNTNRRYYEISRKKDKNIPIIC
ncbi:hypothetical protein MNBD_GAMMA01-620 [hydrothermal vent metagenome]|uniref:Uncharacterized protein n=1 Tax=hydrothermal vent metagenome TaxID=652676 RepID=A0A3B0V3X9_9ZZZZ